MMATRDRRVSVVKPKSTLAAWSLSYTGIE